MSKGLKVLSMFDGISCGRLALENLNIKIDQYYASEIDIEAIKVAQHNFPSTIQIGDAKTVSKEALENFGKIDLLIGGFPCQDLSAAGKRRGLAGDQSSLFYKYIEVLNVLKEKNEKLIFVLENVKSMTKETKEIIDKEIGVKGVMIDSAMFSAQRRHRYYWTNIKIENIPTVKSTEVLGDILDKTPAIDTHINQKLKDIYVLVPEGGNWKNLPANNPERVKIEASRKKHKNPGGQTGFWKLYSKKEKSPTITAQGIKQKMTRFVLRDNDGNYRYPSVEECEALQKIPKGYTSCAKQGKRYHLVGNAWTVSVIEFIFKNHFKK